MRYCWFLGYIYILHEGVPEALSHKNPADFLLKHKSLHMIVMFWQECNTIQHPVCECFACCTPANVPHTHTHMQSPWGQLNPISIIIWSNCVVGYHQHCHMFKNPQNTDWNQLLFVYYPSTCSQTLKYTHTHC